MTKELKIWLDDEQQIVTRVQSLGGSYKGESTSIHTYFNQPEGQVLKLVETNGRVTLDTLQRKGEQFIMVSQEPIVDSSTLSQELTNKHGIKTKLIMHAKSYQLEDYEVSLYDIENVGKFLILTGDNPTVALLDKWFEMSSPKLVTASFDNL